MVKKYYDKLWGHTTELLCTIEVHVDIHFLLLIFTGTSMCMIVHRVICIFIIRKRSFFTLANLLPTKLRMIHSNLLSLTCHQSRRCCWVYQVCVQSGAHSVEWWLGPQHTALLHMWTPPNTSLQMTTTKPTRLFQVDMSQQLGCEVGKQGMANNSTTPRTALSFQEKLPRVGFEPTTLCSLGERSTNWHDSYTWLTISVLSSNTWVSMLSRAIHLRGTLSSVPACLFSWR